MAVPTTLRNIADDARLTMADLAFLSNLPKSTLSRMWEEDDWLDRITGHSLKQLVSVLPGLTAHLSKQSCGPRLSEATRRCHTLGLQVRMERIRGLVRAGCATQRIILALEAAAAIMELDERRSSSYLARCWGAEQDVALDAVLAPSNSPTAILSDNTPLLEKAHQLSDRLATGGRGTSMQTIVGRGILVHKTAKLTAGERVCGLSQVTSNEAFAYRSAVIGRLLGVGDLDTVEMYRRSIEQRPLLRANELWSLSTFAKDVLQTSDFRVPRHIPLSRTIAEIVKDATSLNDAYLYYLVSIAVPSILDHDPTFGLRGRELCTALTLRIEIGLPERVSKACVSMIAAQTINHHHNR